MAFTSPGAPSLKLFTNCQICLNGELIPQDLYFSPETGDITPNYYYRSEGIEKIDLGGAIVAPGFLDLQTNGLNGVHFTTLGQAGAGKDDDADKLARVAEKQLQCGVTAWWATIPTVEKSRWKQNHSFAFGSQYIVSACLCYKKHSPSHPPWREYIMFDIDETFRRTLTRFKPQQILPHLKPRAFVNGASLLGAHVEGPYLHPAKNGAHNVSNLCEPATVSSSSLYGNEHLSSTIRLVTVAPEIPGSIPLIGSLKEEHPHITVSLGHSTASYPVALSALDVGATALTHVFNAMPPLHHRDPGLAGLMTTGRCFYSVIPDGIHLHTSILTMALRTNPNRCVLITDSIELAGLPDGVYSYHGNPALRQQKVGNRVTLEGTETLVGSCILLDECVRNMVVFTGCNIAEAVRCVTENVAAMMGETKRGVLEQGRRADFVVLDPRDYTVRETWMAGRKVWEKEIE